LQQLLQGTGYELAVDGLKEGRGRCENSLSSD